MSFNNTFNGISSHTKVDGILASGISFVNSVAPSGLSANDDFTGNDGDPPNPERWLEVVNDIGYGSIQNNKLNYDSSGAAPTYSEWTSKFTLPSAFDIQIDFSDFSSRQPQSGDSILISLGVHQMSDDLRVGYLSRRWTGSNTNGYGSNGIDAAGYSLYAKSDSSGQLKLVRNGIGVLTAFMWNSGWEWDGNGSGYHLADANTEDVYVRLACQKGQYSLSEPYMSGNIDNFLVNSGTVIWT